MNQLLCPEWVGEWHSATFSTVREWESHPQRQFSVCSRFANHERITARTWITSSQFSVWVTAVPLPAGMLAAELNWTEKGTNQFLKWFRSLRSLKICSFEHVRDRHNTNENSKALFEKLSLSILLSLFIKGQLKLTPTNAHVTITTLLLTLDWRHNLSVDKCYDNSDR